MIESLLYKFHCFICVASLVQMEHELCWKLVVQVICGLLKTFLNLRLLILVWHLVGVILVCLDLSSFDLNLSLAVRNGRNWIIWLIFLHLTLLELCSLAFCRASWLSTDVIVYSGLNLLSVEMLLNLLFLKLNCLLVSFLFSKERFLHFFCMRGFIIPVIIYESWSELRIRNIFEVLF